MPPVPRGTRRFFVILDYCPSVVLNVSCRIVSPPSPRHNSNLFSRRSGGVCQAWHTLTDIHCHTCNAQQSLNAFAEVSLPKSSTCFDIRLQFFLAETMSLACSRLCQAADQSHTTMCMQQVRMIQEPCMQGTKFGSCMEFACVPSKHSGAGTCACSIAAE
jgi:hypothetical protein